MESSGSVGFECKLVRVQAGWNVVFDVLKNQFLNTHTILMICNSLLSVTKAGREGDDCRQINIDINYVLYNLKTKKQLSKCFVRTDMHSIHLLGHKETYNALVSNKPLQSGQTLLLRMVGRRHGNVA